MGPGQDRIHDHCRSRRRWTQSHTFVPIDHDIVSMVILLPSAYSRRVVVSYKQKHVHKVLVSCLVKLVQEKSVVRLTDRPDMTIAVDWDIKKQTKKKPRMCSPWGAIANPQAKVFDPPSTL